MSAPWKPEEIVELAKLYPEQGIHAELPGRSVLAVLHKARKLGLASINPRPVKIVHVNIPPESRWKTACRIGMKYGVTVRGFSTEEIARGLLKNVHLTDGDRAILEELLGAYAPSPSVANGVGMHG